MTQLPHIDTPERGVIMLDMKNTIVYANKRASEILGNSINDIIGRKLPGVVIHRPENFEDVIEEVLEESLVKNSTFHRYSTPVYSEDKKPVGRIEIYSDITARRELEKEILDRNKELAELNLALQEAQEQLIQSERLRALGEMAAGVAHDINNVLGIILGNAQLGSRYVNEPEKTQKCLSAIELAAKDAAATIHRLREIGKPIDTSGYQNIDLGTIVQNMVQAAMPVWMESGSHTDAKIDVETHLENDCRVFGNPIEIREALTNVLINAVQSIDVAGKIDICVRKKDKFAELSVKDSGSGMNEETRKRLFDPFFTTRGAEGTGLGMSMVDAIAIRHRGKVFVDSKEGEGTTITMLLPLA